MKDDKLYLIHLSESIAKIESYMDGLAFAGFMQNTLVQDAVLRNLQVLAALSHRERAIYITTNKKHVIILYVLFSYLAT